MSLKDIAYFSFKIIVTLILIYIGFRGMTASLEFFHSIGEISKFPLFEVFTLGVFINSCLFLAIAVSHNFNPVSKLLKASLINFSVLILLPCLFCFAVDASHGSWMFLLPFLAFSTLFIGPMALVLLSNKLTVRRSPKTAS